MTKKYFGIVKPSEVFVFFFILVSIFGFSFFNFQKSAARERNEERRENLDEIRVALVKFYEVYGFYPESMNGKIVACVGPETVVKRGLLIFDKPVACEWGFDGFSEDPTDDGLVKLLDPIPPDPNASEGFSYLYLSDTESFQIFASYEGKPEFEYDKKIEDLNLPCGTKVCNGGKAGPGVSLEVPVKSVNN